MNKPTMSEIRKKEDARADRVYLVVFVILTFVFTLVFYMRHVSIAQGETIVPEIETIDPIDQVFYDTYSK